MKPEFYRAPEYVKVRDRDDVGKVVMAGKNIGREYCYAVLFETTGEVKYYKTEFCTRCDSNGNEI